MAGVPFESIEGLATCDAILMARKLAAKKAERAKAAAEAEKFFESRQRLLSPEAYQALRLAVRSERAPIAVSGEQPPVFQNYASTAAAVVNLETELDAILLREVSAARASLVKSSREIFLAHYLLFAAEGVRGLLTEQLNKYPADLSELPARNNSARKVEQSLLLYLQRVAAKNDTFSRFGPSGWGKFGAESDKIAFAPESGFAAREVFLERWTAHAVAAAMNADPEIFPELSPRLNPNGVLRGENFQLSETGEISPLGANELEILARCNGKTSVRDLGGAEAEVRSLAERKILHCAMEVPALEPHALAVLRDDVEKWSSGPSREKWLSILQPIADLPAQFIAAEEINDRQKILDEARTRLRAIGAAPKLGERFLYSAINVIGEECFRECHFTIGEKLIDEVAIDAEPWIDFWRDSYAFVASRVAGALRKILEATGTAVPLPAFLRACEAAKLPLTGPGLVGLAAMAFQEVKAAFRDRLRPHADLEEYELSFDDCHVVRDNFQYPKFDEYTFPSADLQISAVSADAVGRGEYQWVIGELHPPAALLHHGFYWSCPDKGTLNDAFAQTVFGKPSFHFGFFAIDFASHTTIRQFDAIPQFSIFVAPQRGNPKWRTVRPADAEVYIEESSGDVCLREIRSREFIGSFARAWLIPLGFHPFQFGLPPHTPRLRCGRVIVQRQAWTVTAEELPAGHYTGVSRDLVLAIDQLRQKKKWPRFIYIRPSEQALRRSGAEGRDKDTKPVFIDLESYLFLEIFQRWLMKSGELEVTEMLPDPNHLLWREADGRRTFELRTLIVPRR